MASYTQLPSGHWRVSVKYRGARDTGTAPTKSAARVLGAQMLTDLGARQTSDTVPVGDLLTGHLSRVEWSPTTLADARRVIGNLPTPFLERLVAEVDGAVLAGLYRQLQGLGWSAHTIRRVHFVISTAWSEAITWGWAHNNPARHVRLPKVHPRDIHPPDTEQVRAVLAHLGGDFLVFARLAATTGCRRGELVALQWGDLDATADGMFVWIARSIVSDGPGRFVERDTKTSRKGHRKVAVDAGTAYLLYDIHRRQLSLDNGFAPQWVFSHDGGLRPWRPDYPTRLFVQARKRANVTDVRLHDLRHYVATKMLQDGEALVDVAGQLGHASLATTSSVYAHQMPGRGRESVERRAALFDG